MQLRPTPCARRLALLGAVATATLGLTGTAGAATVYENDFSSSAGPAFSEQGLSTATRSSGDNQFSGQFGNQTQTLTLDDLPAHTKVTISYDLLVLDSWDGNYTSAGPDRFTEEIGDASTQATTLDTTFSNNPSGDTPQSFPQAYLEGNNPRYTGASEGGTILNHNFFGSSVYHFERTVSHTAGTLKATFTGSGLQDVGDESWGLDNVVVKATDPDTDGDGVLDADDRCPGQAGTVRGCPVPASTTVDVVRNAQLAPAGPLLAGFRYGKGGTTATAQTGFEFGPANPPLGQGSYRISTPDEAAKGQVLSLLPAGDRLGSLTALTYSTYIRQLGTRENRQAPAINIQIDFNGPNVSGGFATLVWEPVNQPTDNGTPATGVWQQRDAVAGGQAVYASTRAINGQPRFNTNADLRTLDQIVANNPDATIDFIAINQGSSNPGLDANVDALRIQSGGKDVTADLEPDVPLLDAFKAANTGDSPTVTASGDLTQGRSYTVTVKGTSSTFAAALMAVKPTKGWAICGTPESAVQFLSPAATNGRAGADAEFLYSFPQQGAKCAASNQAALPKKQSGLRFSLGGTFFAPAANGLGSAPATDHTYTYTVIGQGSPLKVRFPDSNYKDNYGRYQIQVTPVADQPSA